MGVLMLLDIAATAEVWYLLAYSPEPSHHVVVLQI